MARQRRDPDRARRGLHDRDRRLLATIAGDYEDAWRVVKAELDRVGQQIKQARARGETVDQAWLVRQRHLERVEEQALTAFEVFARAAAGEVDDAVVQAIAAGQADAVALAGITGARSSALDEVIRRQRGPSARLFVGMAEDVATKVRAGLIRGVALGQNPLKVATGIRKDLDGPLWRARTIARTEMVSAYRAAALGTYRQHPDVVQTWVWDATLDATTCPVCYAMHGTEFELGEDFDTHPNCRCSPIPRTVSFASLGAPDATETAVTPVSGEDVFRRLPAGTQRAILGPGKFAAWRGNRIRLEDLVAETTGPYGKGRRERSLPDALEAARVRRARGRMG